MTITKDKPTLPTFEQMDVSSATVRITNAGDGLSAALEVDPKALHISEQVFYVLSGEVTQINHVEKDGILTRVHTVKASAITEVDRDIAEKILAEAAEELRRRQDEISGQMRTDDETAAAEREAADAVDTPGEIATAAAARAKG